MKISTVLFISILFVGVFSHSDNSCKHGMQSDFNQSEYPTMDLNFQFSQERHLQLSQPKPERPFKISYDMSFFKKSLTNSTSDTLFLTKVEQLMRISTKYFSNLLKITPKPEGQMKWTLERRVCGGGNLLAKIPESDRTDDKNSDLHLYIVFMDQPTDSYVAYAASCRELPGLGPTHGQITFNYGWFKKQNFTDDKIFYDMQGTLFHEIIHVLGFSDTSYKNWIDRTTNKPYLQVTVNGNSRGKLVRFIQTPNVKKLAQEYYNCPSLSGMPLENQGSSGSAGSHWEATLMVDEMMKSTVIKTQTYLSPFTLALLKDTGYFTFVNDKMGDKYYYGKGAGCEFVLGDCSVTQFKNELCSKESENPENQCDYYATGVSNCESGKFLDDKCYQRVVDDKGRCFDAMNNSKSSSLYTQFYGQYFGENSRCFMSTLVQKMVGFPYSLQGSCYKYECIQESQQLRVFAGKESAICSKNGEKINFKNYDGYLQCPEKIEEFCKFKQFCPKYCSSRGYCDQGKCICLDEFTGISCETISTS